MRRTGIVAALACLCSVLLAVTVATAATALSWRMSAPVTPSHPATSNLDDISCPSSQVCVAVDDRGYALTSTDASQTRSHWHSQPIGTKASPFPPGAVACPAMNLCVAAGAADIATTTNPTALPAQWHVQVVAPDPSYGAGGALHDVVCPTSALCVASGGGNVVTSTDPGAPTPTWTVTKLEDTGSGENVDVSCATATFCEGVDGNKSVFTTTNPTGGAGAWTRTQFAGFPGLGGIECPSVSLCVAVGFDNGVGPLVGSSTNPAGGAHAWKLVHLPSKLGQVDGLACPAVNVCAAGAEGGNVISSSNPAGAASAWKTVHVHGKALLGVACASPSMCFALQNASAYRTQHPLGRSRAWRLATVDRFTAWRPLVDISCVPGSLCLGLDDRGDMLLARRPTASMNSWKRLFTDRLVGDVSCASAKLCIAAEGHGDVLVTTHPTAGRRAWAKVRLAPGSFVSAVHCATPHVCLAGDGETAAILSSTNPTGGRTAWHRVQTPGNGDSAGQPVAFSCPSKSLCVGVDRGTGEGMFGDIFTTTNPAARKPAWELTNYFDVGTFTGVACPSTTLCLASAPDQQLAVSTRPTVHSSWHLVTLSGDGAVSFDDVSCPSTTFCVLADDAGNVVTSSNPTGDATAWSSTNVDPGAAISSLTCTGVTRCVAGDDSGRVLVGTG